MFDLWSWISPFDTFRAIADVVDASAKVRLSGFQHGVLLPTLYDDWTQSQLTNNLGPELKVQSPEHAGQIRAAIEAFGTPCGGWSVPRATGDVAAEGYAHGVMAAQFEYFVLNFEDGWAGFWTVDGASIVELWIGAFWSGYADGRAALGLPGDKPNVGVTMVTNTGMMNAVSDAEAAAWVAGTNFDCLEAYIPGDPGLDPGNALDIWNARLARIGVTGRSVVPIVENGDLATLIPQYADAVRGAQIWTLSTAAAYAWPAVVEPNPDPPQPGDDTAALHKRINDLQTTVAVMGGDVADSLNNTADVLATTIATTKGLTKKASLALTTSTGNVHAAVDQLRKLRADSEASG